ncbi:MAG: polysaccharide deacetylase family protein [Bacteroidales bacterium]|jgi:hypothetical protein|nr:polysaccharide deacetylase family protein [Bacteroidales bacterium]
MILIYSKTQTERLRYITRHIFDRYLGIPSRICTDSSVFELSKETKLNYSDTEMETVPCIVPHSLLFETDIRPQKVEISICEDMPVCFADQQTKDAFPFDVFAACFFFLSRYEEYLPYKEDEHQRYDGSNSLAVQHHFLHLCVVDCWIRKLSMFLKTHYPNIVFAERKFTFIPTSDIDMAYAYRHKGFLRNMASYVRSAMRLDVKQIVRQTKVLLRCKKDPYDTFDYLSGLHRLYGLNPCYFFLLAKRRSAYDKNTHRSNKSFRRLIRSLSNSCDIGLHTSYYVKDDPDRIDDELSYLRDILCEFPVKNRHHYLRFSLPESYRLLESRGIKEEYSMGYVNSLGFRAGTCTPFLFFDLEQNRSSNMQIYPLLGMENALRHIPEATQIVDAFIPYIEEVRRYQGVLITLFHNQSFGDGKDGKKWRTAYEQLLKYIHQD